MSNMDHFLGAADSALRTLFATPRASRACATLAETPGQALSEADRRLSGALMRVNHVGEVCAQALYTAQALAARQPWGGSGGPREALAQQLEAAGRKARQVTPKSCNSRPYSPQPPKLMTSPRIERLSAEISSILTQTSSPFV